MNEDIRYDFEIWFKQQPPVKDVIALIEDIKSTKIKETVRKFYEFCIRFITSDYNFDTKEHYLSQKQQLENYLDKAVSYLQCLGVQEYQFNYFIEKETLEFILDHYKELKRELTNNDIRIIQIALIKAKLDDVEIKCLDDLKPIISNLK